MDKSNAAIVQASIAQVVDLDPYLTVEQLTDLLCVHLVNCHRRNHSPANPLGYSPIDNIGSIEQYHEVCGDRYLACAVENGLMRTACGNSHYTEAVPDLCHREVSYLETDRRRRPDNRSPRRHPRSSVPVGIRLPMNRK